MKNIMIKIFQISEISKLANPKHSNTWIEGLSIFDNPLSLEILTGNSLRF